MTPEWHPPKFDLVRNHTPAKVNQEIDTRTVSTLTSIGDDPHAIRRRLWALDREWHLDRALMALFSVLGSYTASKKRLRPLFWVQMGFLFHHAIRGWCPPVSVLRRIGFRTEKEIGAERTALEKRLAATTSV